MYSFHTDFCRVGNIRDMSYTNSGIWSLAHQPKECAQGLFKVGLDAGSQPTCIWHSQKYLGLHRHSPKAGCLRHQAINVTPTRRVKASRDGPLRLEEKKSPRRTRPDPYRSCHGQPKCVPSKILLSYSNNCQWTNLDSLYGSHTSAVETYLHTSDKCSRRCFVVRCPRLVFFHPFRISSAIK